MGDFQIGPYFFPAHPNGRIYADFIENQLPVLLEDIPRAGNADCLQVQGRHFEQLLH
ncbi:hypothetical protein ALC60_04170 [Trachymyrmex zeteki]|uniref:Uncharacterized protein n=1 Tax=Mycetomoellerius zeteki TaxID=64791 RepID=A0A151X928_9HYME|nr:hypothetical protein ALC60_04170 [Trachymyrmex zeteki]